MATSVSSRPLAELTLRGTTLMLGPENPQMGGRSAKAITFLKEQGFNNLVNMAGGITGWSDQVDSSVPKY